MIEASLSNNAAENSGCCPICASKERQQVVEKRGIAIWCCHQCAHWYCDVVDQDVHVSSTYGDNYFRESSEGYLDYAGEESIQRRSAKYYLRQLKKNGVATGRMLDVGCACGFLLDEFQQAGWSAVGVEPNASMATLGRQQFGLDIVHGELAQLDREGHFELITSIQVISHLIDPLSTLRSMRERLTDAGYLLIETWDRQSLAARLSGASWHELNPPSVLHWFSRNSLRSAVEQAGFELVTSGLPQKRIQLGRACALLRHSFDRSRLVQVLTSPLRLVPQSLTVPYVLGDAFWMLFRRSS